MAYSVYPSVNAIGASSAVSKQLRERNETRRAKMYVRDNFVEAAGDFLPTAGSGLTLDIASGEAIIDGYFVSSDATDSIALSASATNYVFLTLPQDGLLNVLTPVLSANTTGASPSVPFVLLCTAVTDGSSITSITDRRVVGFTLMNTFLPKERIVVSVDATTTGNKAFVDIPSGCMIHGISFENNPGSGAPATDFSVVITVDGLTAQAQEIPVVKSGYDAQPWAYADQPRGGSSVLMLPYKDFTVRNSFKAEIKVNAAGTGTATIKGVCSYSARV